MAIKNFYAVAHGRECNVIVETWAECEALVKGFSKAKFKGFKWRHEAEAYLGEYAETQNQKTAVKAAQQTKFLKTASERGETHGIMPCLERKSYYDPVKGVYYKNRCVRRQGPTMKGKKFKRKKWKKFVKSGKLPW